MERFMTSTPQHFSIFRPVAEEAATKMQHDQWADEGGHMSSTSGRVVITPGAELRYKVILRHPGLPDSEHAFATMRASEAFIWRNTPPPRVRRNTLRDQGPCAL